MEVFSSLFIFLFLYIQTSLHISYVPIFDFTNILFTDVKDVKFVINYDFPTNIEDYVHRVGRTGRGGNFGHSFTFFTADNARQARELVDILNQTKQPVDPRLQAMVQYRGSGGGGRGGGYRGRGGRGRGGFSRGGGGGGYGGSRW